MNWSERASHHRRPHALAMLGISCIASSALVLASCAPSGAKPATSGEENALDAQTSKAAFAQLNAVQRHADTLPNALAVHDYFVTQHQHSGGLTRDFLGQVLAASDAELGNYESAVREFSQGPMTLRSKVGDLPDAGSFHASDAADAVGAQARDRRIVMVNEAHHVGETRLLTLALLPRLHEMGFTHFAVEGLDEHDRDLVARGYPTKASGPYIREPLYGDIVRIALRPASSSCHTSRRAPMRISRHARKIRHTTFSSAFFADTTTRVSLCMPDTRTCTSAPTISTPTRWRCA
jgi:hypothetical protein